MRGAQVGGDNVFVGTHFFGCAVTNFLAVVQHHDAIGDVHHHAHVVFDQDNGGAKLFVYIQDEARHVLLFFHVHTGHGLIEQQDLGLHRQSATQVNPFLQAVGQLTNRCFAVGLNFQEVDNLFDMYFVIVT